MQTAADRVSEEAMALPADARIVLVDKILASLNLPSQPDIDRLWAEEAERRIGEMERGEVIPVPAEEVFDRIRRKYSK
jgi:putative addiction module component (TIGR02574 family)